MTFRIVAEPRGDGERSTLVIMPEGADRQDALGELAAFVEAIEQDGAIPHRWTLDWAWSPGTAVRRRYGEGTYLIRCEAWEHETENGYDEGYGWLKVVEDPE